MALVGPMFPVRDASLVDHGKTILLEQSPLEYEGILEEFYHNVEEQIGEEEADAGEAQVEANQQDLDAPPALPERSAGRASRRLDGLDLKRLNTPVESPALSAVALPHDVYLSSEEDASFSGDDFSDYGYETSSSTDGAPTSPVQRKSHEDTARVVSVVFFGKPSIVTLSTKRCSASPASNASQPKQSCLTKLPALYEGRSPSPASRPPRAPRLSIASITSTATLAMAKSKPPRFLSIDPYANGSTYSLELRENASQHPLADQQPRLPPKSPTALFRGMSRTLSLARKRSRSDIRISASLENTAYPAIPSSPVPARPPSRLARISTNRSLHDHAGDQKENREGDSAGQASAPVTYSDIMGVARRNAVKAAVFRPRTPGTTMDQAQPPPPCRAESRSPSPSLSQQPQPPASPLKRGLLSGLAARRRSVRYANGKPA